MTCANILRRCTLPMVTAWRTQRRPQLAKMEHALAVGPLAPRARRRTRTDSQIVKLGTLWYIRDPATERKLGAEAPYAQ